MVKILDRRLILRGFNQTQFAEEQVSDLLAEAGPWVADGRLRGREYVVHGLGRAPEASMGQLKGRNFGKVVVHVGEP